MDDLDSEFGASPLGKAGSRGGGDTTTAPAAETQPYGAAAPLPDLYGDLYGDTGEGNLLLKTQVAQLKDQCSNQEKLIQELQQQLETLTNENTELQTLKTTLTKNISSLFNTAKLEIERKDVEIKNLRGKIASGGGAGSRPGGGGGGRSSSRPSEGRGRDTNRDDRHRSSSEGRDRRRERERPKSDNGR